MGGPFCQAYSLRAYLYLCHVTKFMSKVLYVIYEGVGGGMMGVVSSRILASGMSSERADR